MMSHVQEIKREIKRVASFSITPRCPPNPTLRPRYSPAYPMAKRFENESFSASCGLASLV